MKITKRQLKRIIKEEKRKLLRETVMDMDVLQGELGSFPESLAGKFGHQMMELFWEEDSRESDTFRDTSEAEWEQQVAGAENYLVGILTERIEDAVTEVEAMLHDGKFER